jgi:large subunit ribosomal protein L27
MAHRKAGGTAKNLRDSQPKYLGIKISDGASAKAGAVIVRQRGTRYRGGNNVGMGDDHTLFALVAGTVSFKEKRHLRFDNKEVKRKVVSVTPYKEAQKEKKK